MAAYTSTQSGNFSANSTWGGGGSPSANGDTFNVAYGHTVTLDTAFSISSGFGDSYIYGMLKNSQSANTELRMNGRLYIKGGGCLHLCDNSGAVTTKILFDGTRSDTHGLWQENETDAHMVLEGVDGMPSTTLSAQENENSTSLAVASGTNFAAGEWIAVFDHQTAMGASNGAGHSLRDEGFIIHEVDGNTIYFRHFVGPDDVTISSVNGAKITVNNAKKHRFGQYVIFGTGSNRNIKQISSIDLLNNEITLDSDVTGSVVGEIIHLTGTEKIHISGDKVRKVATRITSESTGATITVANANKFAVGDEIFLAAPYTGSGNDTNYNAYEYKHTIQSISGNNITLTSAPSYTAKVNAFVTRLTRNIIIGGLDTSDRTYYYSEYLSDGDYSKTTIIKDVYFKDIGNNSNNAYSGWSLRGRGNSQVSQVNNGGISVSLTEQIPQWQRQPWLEGFTCTFVENRDHSGIWLWQSRYAQVRCAVTYNANDGLHSWWESGQAFYNCISARNDNRGARTDGQREYQEFAYNYMNRNYYGISHGPTEYEPNAGYHHCIIDCTNHYAMQSNGADNYRPDGFYAWDIRGCRYAFYGKQWSMLYSRVVENTTFEAVDDAGVGDHGGTSVEGHGYARMQRGSAGNAALTILEYDFEIDRVAQYNFRVRRIWHEEEGAWAFRRRSQNEWSGFGHNVYVPAGVTVIARCALRAPTGTSYTQYPRIYSSEHISGIDDNRIGNSSAGNARGAGQYYNVSYDSGMIGDNYQTKTLTIPAKNYPRTLNILVVNYYGADQEGFFMRELEIGFSKPYEVKEMAVANTTSDIFFAPENRTSFATVKKRIGGRLR